VIHDRDPDVISGQQSVAGVLNDLKATPFTIYGDEPFDVVAIVSHPPGEIPILTKLLPSRNGILNNVIDNVFNAIKKDHRKLFWTARVDDENRAWHYERADGSFTRAGKSLFWYGIQDIKEVEAVIKDFESKKRVERAFLPVGPTPPPHRVNDTATPAGTRAFSTAARRPALSSTQLGLHTGSSRGYATAVQPKKVALIGARGFTGQALVSLLNTHPTLNLTHVSSRELAGSQLAGYTKTNITYENLGPQEVQKMEENGEVDAWVMALPNGVCKPFVDAVDRAKGKSVVVDLSADYRFEPSAGWTYGLPGKREATL